jgi:uncharacterized protein YutE (UPF0331/DUF86 family)
VNGIRGFPLMKSNIQLIKDKFVHSQKYLEEVKRVLEIPLAEYLADLDVQLKAERLYEILTQAILDVCTHVISREKADDPPKNYGECMIILEKIGILDKKKGEGVRFQSMIKMRNFIVHDYARIDNKIVYTSLKDLVDDFALFQRRVLDWFSGNKITGRNK